MAFQMTPEELEAHKQKIKTVMVDHLTTLGYPEIEKPAIMNELKNMWIKLEEANLILPGMTFEMFCRHAEDRFMLDDIQQLMGLTF